MIDFGFGADTKKHPSVAEIGYPTYHTAYETFDLIERIVDPGFKLLSLSTKMTLSLVRAHTFQQSENRRLYGP